MKYRVIYGETMPAWTKELSTEAAVLAWVKRCLDLGDLIFGIEALEEGDTPQFMSLADALAAANDRKQL